MAPSTKESIPGGDERINLLKQAFRCTNGKVNFDMLATKMGSPNGQAVLKKFKRVFEKDEEPLNMVGSTLNSGSDGSSPAKPNRTPKPKTSSGDESSISNRKAKPAAKKRKVAEVNEESELEADEEETIATPPKKTRTTKAKPIITPKSPNTPNTPRAPRTPKGAAIESPKTYDLDESETDFKDDGDKTRTGSPEVQAKTDAVVKQNEKTTGLEVGEVEKQAIRDGVEKEMATSDHE